MQLGKTYRNNIFSLARSPNHIITYLVCSARERARACTHTHTHTHTHCISFSSMSIFWIYLLCNIFPFPRMVFHELILLPIQENCTKVLTKKPNKCIVKLMNNYILKDRFIYTFFSLLWPHFFSCISIYLHFFKYDTWIAFYN